MLASRKGRRGSFHEAKESGRSFCHRRVTKATKMTRKRRRLPNGSLQFVVRHLASVAVSCLVTGDGLGWVRAPDAWCETLESPPDLNS